MTEAKDYDSSLKKMKRIYQSKYNNQVNLIPCNVC